jgi:hypothetical protein
MLFLMTRNTNTQLPCHAAGNQGNDDDIVVQQTTEKRHGWDRQAYILHSYSGTIEAALFFERTTLTMPLPFPVLESLPRLSARPRETATAAPPAAEKEAAAAGGAPVMLLLLFVAAAAATAPFPTVAVAVAGTETGTGSIPTTCPEVTVARDDILRGLLFIFTLD